MEKVEYPKWKYHMVKEATIVESKDAEAALGDDWVDSPAALKPDQDTKVIAEEVAVKKPIKKAKA